MAQAVIRSLAVNAAKGSQRAQRLFAEFLVSVESANKRLHDEWLETAINYKVDWGRELVRRQDLGVDAAVPIPHPDDIIIDMRTGLVRVNGPMTKEEKVVWDRFRERKAECDHTIAELGSCFRASPIVATENLSSEIEHERRIRAIGSASV